MDRVEIRFWGFLHIVIIAFCSILFVKVNGDGAGLQVLLAEATHKSHLAAICESKVNLKCILIMSNMKQ